MESWLHLELSYDLIYSHGKVSAGGQCGFRHVLLKKKERLCEGHSGRNECAVGKNKLIHDSRNIVRCKRTTASRGYVILSTQLAIEDARRQHL